MRSTLVKLRKTVSILEVIFQLTFSQIPGYSVEYNGLNANGCSSMVPDP